MGSPPCFALLSSVAWRDHTFFWVILRVLHSDPDFAIDR